MNTQKRVEVPELYTNLAMPEYPPEIDNLQKPSSIKDVLFNKLQNTGQVLKSIKLTNILNAAKALGYGATGLTFGIAGMILTIPLVLGGGPVIGAVCGFIDRKSLYYSDPTEEDQDAGKTTTEGRVVGETTIEGRDVGCGAIASDSKQLSEKQIIINGAIFGALFFFLMAEMAFDYTKISFAEVQKDLENAVKIWNSKPHPPRGRSEIENLIPEPSPGPVYTGL
jgi:hypothetical protein